MHYTILGNTKLKVSCVGIGTWALGGLAWNLNMDSGWSGSSDKESLRGLCYAYDNGVNYFDTADIYGHGHSERLIGQFIRENNPQDIIISSKVGYFKGTSIHAFHPNHMRNQVETTLRNIGVDCLDLYSFHNTNFGQKEEYRDDAIETMHKFIQEGKIKHIGLRIGHIYTPNKTSSNQNTKLFRDYDLLKLISPAIIQLKYNLLEWDTWPSQIFNWVKEENAGIIFNKPFAQGLLLGKYNYQSPPIFPEGDHRRRKSEYKVEFLKKINIALNKLTVKFGLSPQDLISLCFQACFSKHPEACTVFGFKTEEQVKLNLKASQSMLPKEVLTFAKEVIRKMESDVKNIDFKDCR